MRITLWQGLKCRSELEFWTAGDLPAAFVLPQVAMPLYQFTSEHNVLEAARRLLQAGSTSFKFDLKNQRANGRPIKVQQQTNSPRLSCLSFVAAHANATLHQLRSVTSISGSNRQAAPM
jgi:hypothetical protein